MASLLEPLKKGMFEGNPTLVLLIGLCPTLATTTSFKNAMGMGFATLFVLVMSNLSISAFNRFFPKKIRIPCFIVLIASFVIIVEMVMKAWAPPEINTALGIFIPLIVVNCIILGRAEAYASKNPPLESIFDGLGSGIGFIIALGLLSFIRELLGSFAIFGIPFTQKQAPISIFITSAGAFIVMGAIQAYLSYRKVRAKENGFTADAARLAKGKLITSKTNKPPVDATPKPAAPAAPTAPAQA